MDGALHGSGIATWLLDSSSVGAAFYVFMIQSWIAENSSPEHLNKLLSAGTSEGADNQYLSMRS